MKGIILAGGKATRMYPVTKAVCKQLLPVYDKPMVYYPLSVLMLAGIREIMLISTRQDLPRFRQLLGDGRRLGIKLIYARQDEPRGIAESLIIAEDFIKGEPVGLILGDNIFYGHNLVELLKKSSGLKEGAAIFGYWVNNPQRYGVISFDRRGNITGITEKPRRPASNWAVTGLYFYDAHASSYARRLRPSKRGELEITELNAIYLRSGTLKVKLLGRGFAWLDTGTPDSLIDASVFIKTIEERQGLKIGCVEEVAYRQGFISKSGLKAATGGVFTAYADYLRKIYAEG